jgi:hypothetical protein
MKPDSEEMTKQLARLRADYVEVEKKPFRRFYCPIMGQDHENADLCLGHVINQKIPNSSRKTIVQRKDVDGFYGRLLEPAFITIMQMQNQSKGENFYNREIRKKVRLEILINGEVCEYYEDRGLPVPPRFTVRSFSSKQCGDLKIVFKKPPHEFDKPLTWKFRMAHDARIETIGSLLKAAYLALFRIMGYRFALSAGGLEIGYNVIGRFFREHRNATTKNARRAAGLFFRQYVNLVRPVANYNGALPAGTLDTGKGHMCSNANDFLFASLVYVRMDKHVAAVLMPAFHDVPSAAAYVDFLKNKDQRLLLREFTYSEDTDKVHINHKAVSKVWPKDEDNSDLD